MPWITTNTATTKLQVGKRTLERLIAKDEIPSKLQTNESGRSVRMVWIRSGKIPLEEILLARFEELNQRVTELAEQKSTEPSPGKKRSKSGPPKMAEVKTLKEKAKKAPLKILALTSPALADQTLSKQGIKNKTPETLSIAPSNLAEQPFAPQFEEILSMVKDRWTGSSRSLSDSLGFHSTWIFEAQRGKLRTKRCWPRWRKLETFLLSLTIENREAA